MEQEEASVEQFRATSGRITGVCGVVIASAGVLLGIVEYTDGFPVWATALCLAAAIGCWLVLLRPGLWVEAQDLVMRGVLSTVRIPLAAVEQVAVRQVTAVRAGDSRYVSSVIGQRWRSMVTTSTRDVEKARASGKVDYALWVEERISELAAQARAVHRVRPGSKAQAAFAEQVERTWDVGALVAAGVAVAALLVALFA